MEPSLAIESSESQNSLNRNKDFSFNLVLTWLGEKLEGLFQMEERPNKLRTVFTVFSQFDKLFVVYSHCEYDTTRTNVIHHCYYH